MVHPPLMTYGGAIQARHRVITGVPDNLTVRHYLHYFIPSSLVAVLYLSTRTYSILETRESRNRHHRHQQLPLSVS